MGCQRPKRSNRRRNRRPRALTAAAHRVFSWPLLLAPTGARHNHNCQGPHPATSARGPLSQGEIGRASCRERGYIALVAVALNKKEVRESIAARIMLYHARDRHAAPESHTDRRP